MSLVENIESTVMEENLEQFLLLVAKLRIVGYDEVNNLGPKSVRMTSEQVEILNQNRQTVRSLEDFTPEIIASFEAIQAVVDYHVREAQAGSEPYKVYVLLSNLYHKGGDPFRQKEPSLYIQMQKIRLFEAAVERMDASPAPYAYCRHEVTKLIWALGLSDPKLDTSTIMEKYVIAWERIFRKAVLDPDNEAEQLALNQVMHSFLQCMNGFHK